MSNETERIFKPHKDSSLSDETFNRELTAIPQAPEDDKDLSGQVGEMNVSDAKESGYINESGKAAEKAKEDVLGIPTGAYTDIGAGRSSAVKHAQKGKDQSG